MIIPGNCLFIYHLSIQNLIMNSQFQLLSNRVYHMLCAYYMITFYCQKLHVMWWTWMCACRYENKWFFIIYYLLLGTSIGIFTYMYVYIYCISICLSICIGIRLWKLHIRIRICICRCIIGIGTSIGICTYMYMHV